MACRWLLLALWALVAFALILFNQFAGRVVPLPPGDSVPGHAAALVYLALLLLALMRAAQASAHLPQRTWTLVTIGLPFAYPILAMLLATYVPSAGFLLTPLRRLPPEAAMVWTTLLGPVGLALLGAAAGRQFTHPHTLLAAAGFAVFFDIVVVTMGTVAVLLQHTPQAITAVSVGGPVLPGPRLARPLSAVTIGPADVLFVSIFLAAVVRLHLSERATFHTMFVALILALALAQTTPLPVPALVPMGVAVLAANAHHARLTAEEKRHLVYGGLFALFLAALLVAGARTLLAR